MDYGCAGQIGTEPTPAEYVMTMRALFLAGDPPRVWRRWHRVAETGDSHYGDDAREQRQGRQAAQQRGNADRRSRGLCPADPPKGTWHPARVAFAPRFGWWLRSDIIWSKPKPAYPSVTTSDARVFNITFPAHEVGRGTSTTPTRRRSGPTARRATSRTATRPRSSEQPHDGASVHRRAARRSRATRLSGRSRLSHTRARTRDDAA